MDHTPSIDALRTALLDISEPVGKRTRAVFYLRSIGSEEALDILCLALSNKKDSDLMRHEIAYVIGQMQNSKACSLLTRILQDTSDDSMVRHEAAESLGAIGDVSAIPVLETFSTDPAVEVAQTCILALDLIRYRKEQTEGALKEEGNVDRNPYLSVDPAPAAHETVATEELKRVLLDTSDSLFNRYRAMFSLRNRNDVAAAQALSSAFEDPSALFRHEIAYVMGQMENVETISALSKVLNNASEHRMVRHEAAEALGAIGTSECMNILKGHAQDKDAVVRESVDVALDIIDYWQS